MEAEPDLDYSGRLAELKEFFLSEQKPHKFNPYENDNILMTLEQTFEELVNTMQENGSVDPKSMTEFEWYSKIKFLDKKYKEMEKARR